MLFRAEDLKSPVTLATQCKSGPYWSVSTGLRVFARRDPHHNPHPTRALPRGTVRGGNTLVVAAFAWGANLARDTVSRIEKNKGFGRSPEEAMLRMLAAIEAAK